jgi:hypothetical protein
MVKANLELNSATAKLPTRITLTRPERSGDRCLGQSSITQLSLCHSHNKLLGYVERFALGISTVLFCIFEYLHCECYTMNYTVHTCHTI